VVAKLASALAAGCTLVLKPSEIAPLSAFALAEVVHAAGLPRGVFNLVCGTGLVAGEALAAHPDVDMVSFTGSTRAGRRVSELASRSVKRVALELGGKSAAVVLEDADLKRAVRQTLNSCFLNSGQTCNALTRLLVPRAKSDEAAALAAEGASGFRVGDPFGGEAKLGPLISAAQRERVRGYIKIGIEEGARVLAGGPDAPEGLPKGYYVRPTVFGGVQPQMTIANEEIFGPVLSVLSYADEEDAIAIANGTPYGLAAAVFSADEVRARAVARRLRAGQVDINGGKFNALAPSVASSNRATGASWAATASRSSWRRSRCSYNI
jgi:betaine-aldehyde dehydrogenase